MNNVALLLAALLLALLAACGDDDGTPSSATPTPAGEKCGVERWTVKTMSDARAGQVGLTPTPSTVDDLRALPTPKGGVKKSTARLDGVEMSTFTVQALLIEYKREDDEDIHLVIASPSDPSHTMIVELPNTKCAGAITSVAREQMDVARAAFVAACDEPVGSFKKLEGTATITGVGFFDKAHGQRGLAPNAIELHPLLAFESFDCRLKGQPPPTPTATPPMAPAATP